MNEADGAHKSNWTRTGRYRMVLVFTLLGAVALAVPMQHLMRLGRYQHYAIGITLFGLGHLLQLIVSWKKFPPWGRLALTGSFLVTVGYVFWSNPWLDRKVAVQTENKEEVRIQLMQTYLGSAAIIILCWIKWAQDERQRKQQKLNHKGDGS